MFPSLGQQAKSSRSGCCESGLTCVVYKHVPSFPWLFAGCLRVGELPACIRFHNGLAGRRRIFVMIWYDMVKIISKEPVATDMCNAIWCGRRAWDPVIWYGDMRIWYGMFCHDTSWYVVRWDVDITCNELISYGDLNMMWCDKKWYYDMT